MQLSFLNIDKPEELSKSPIKRWKQQYDYRRSSDPIDRCYFCKHIRFKQVYLGGRWIIKHKCEILGDTNSNNTDISSCKVCNLLDVNWERVEI